MIYIIWYIYNAALTFVRISHFNLYCHFNTRLWIGLFMAKLKVSSLKSNRMSSYTGGLNILNAKNYLASNDIFTMIHWHQS